MSTTLLPPLPPHSNIVTQQVLESLTRDKSHVSKATAKKFGYGKNTVSLSKLQNVHKDTIMIDTSKYRNSFMHNLSLEMLQEGYHMAFRELFNLVNGDKNKCHVSSSVKISEDHEKLTVLRDYLIAAEKAKRQGRTDQVYEAQLSLAIYFDNKKNYELADHFYEASFHTTLNIRGDGRRKEAEANCNLGSAAERREDYISAKKFYEAFHSISLDKTWTLDDGMILHNHACNCLKRVYVTLAKQLHTDNKEEVLAYLHKAHDVAKQGGDLYEIGEVGYIIGNKYDYYGDQETAVKYHTEYLQLCESINDLSGIGKACQALAYANQRQGRIDLATENLRKFLLMSEKSTDQGILREACSDLAALYQTMGKYEQASNYYKRAFGLAKEESSWKEVETARCEYAIALANGLLTGESQHIYDNKKSNLEALLYWKSERVQDYSSDNRTYNMFVTLENKLNQVNSTDENNIQVSPQDAAAQNVQETFVENNSN